MGFAQGMNAGIGLVRSYRQGERQRTLDEQADQEFARKKQGWTREDQQIAREEEAWGQYDAARSGVGATQQQEITGTYGMTPKQTAAASAGGPEALRTKLASYDQPDNFELQNAPAAPRPTAGGLKLGAPSELDMERSLGAVSAAKRDITGVRASQANERVIGQREIFNRIGKMSDDEIAAMAPKLNTNNSNVPILYTGKGKGGYTFMTTDPDGTPGQKFSLNAAQMRQLAAANELAANGFGAEGLELASKTHTAINAAMTAFNGTTEAATKSNNTAQHYANADANANARTGIAAQGLALQKQRAGQEDWSIVGASDDNKGLLRFNRRTGQTVVQPLPEGTDAAGLFRRVTGAGSGGSGKAREVPAAGTILQDDSGRTFKSDGMGGQLGIKAPLPDQRAKILDDAGIDPGFAEALQWDRTGQYVRHGGQNYDSTKPADMRALRKDVERLARNTRDLEEYNLRSGTEGSRQRQRAERSDPNYFKDESRPGFNYARP